MEGTGGVIDDLVSSYYRRKVGMVVEVMGSKDEKGNREGDQTKPEHVGYSNPSRQLRPT